MIERGKPEPAFIELRNVSKSYRAGKRSLPIFRDLTLSFNRGEFTAITGPSGSGKTTLLNILGGIDRVSAGQFLFDGLHVENLRDSALTRWRARNVGVIFQFYNLMPMLSAAQNIELPLLLTPLRRRERRARVEMLLDIVGLSDRRRHRPSELSGGEQQRVAIARALALDPKLVIADEPTGDLDRETADQILTMLNLLSAELGKTVVMVTHDILAAGHSKRRLHLDKGVLLDVEPTR